MSLKRENSGLYVIYGQQMNMDCEQVIAKLREHEQELRTAGVVRLSLFGSTARGDHRPDPDPDPDIDVLAAFDNTRRISLLDIAGIEPRISEMLSCPIELVEEGTLKSQVRKNVATETILAF